MRHYCQVCLFTSGKELLILWFTRRSYFSSTSRFHAINYGHYFKLKQRIPVPNGTDIKKWADTDIIELVPTSRNYRFKTRVNLFNLFFCKWWDCNETRSGCKDASPEHVISTHGQKASDARHRTTTPPAPHAPLIKATIITYDAACAAIKDNWKS